MLFMKSFKDEFIKAIETIDYYTNNLEYRLYFTEEFIDNHPNLFYTDDAGKIRDTKFHVEVIIIPKFPKGEWIVK